MTQIHEVNKRVYLANKKIVKKGLVIQSFGNASCRFKNLCIIKPSGVKIKKIRIKDMVSVELDSSKCHSKLKPSSDTPTHIEIYKAYDQINGIVHTHSIYATSWAQSNKPIPCFGTTHADYWINEIPITDTLSDSYIKDQYEKNTGIAIINKLKQLNYNPLDCPGILVANHGVFSWGKTIEEAVRRSEMIEYIAYLAFNSLLISPELTKISHSLQTKHFKRKHGPKSYYGQLKDV